MYIRILLSLITLLLTANISFSSVFPNYRIYPGSNIAQSETEIVRHPFNPLIMFASAITINNLTAFKSEGIYVTTNGGINWFGSDTCFGNPLINHGGDPNPIIDKDGRFVFTHIGSFITGMYSHYSTNNGLTWSNQYPIATGDMDKGDIATDYNPASPYYGNTYTGFVAFNIPYKVLFSKTTNGGVNWSVRDTVNNPPQRCQGTEIKVDNSGNIFICWAGTLNASPFSEDYIGFSISSDAGTNWNTRENIYDMNGISGTLPQKGNIRVNGSPRMDIDRTGGTRDGWIYIVTTEKNLLPAGSDPDIVLHRSTNSGQNWSPGIRVNQDNFNNGKIQYFPAIRVDESGGLNIIYYDDRRTTSDSAEVYLSRSTTGGDSWSDIPICDHKFKPEPIAGGGAGYQGDNIGITSGNNILWPLWVDNSTGIYQAWTVSIDLNSIGIKNISNEIPSGFELKQNYPNPFNPSTKISFSIPFLQGSSSGERTFLKVYDILGKEIVVLVNENLNPGTYEVTFDASGLTSGVYFYTLNINFVSITKSMLLLK